MLMLAMWTSVSSLPRAMLLVLLVLAATTTSSSSLTATTAASAAETVAGNRFQKKNLMDVHPESFFNRTLVFGVPISYDIEDIYYSVRSAPASLCCLLPWLAVHIHLLFHMLTIIIIFKTPNFVLFSRGA